MIRRRLTRGALLASIASLVLTGCAGDAELDTLKPKGPYSRDIDQLLDPVLIVAAVVLAFVLGGSLFMAWKFRVKEYEDGDWPEQLHGNTRLEILWTIIPAAILFVVSVFTISTLFGLNDDKANAMAVEVNGETVSWEPTIVVVGQQWWWEYRYYFDGIDVSQYDRAQDLPPADIVTSTQMVIPAGQEIELIVTSRDVIHSHWIPALNGKRDAVPGRFSPWLIEADEPGVYFGQCTEFCGLSHSRMRMQTVALSEADFQNWVDVQLAPYEPPTEQAAEWIDQQNRIFDGETIDPEDEVAAPDATAVERGMVTFRISCTRCHQVRGVNDQIYQYPLEPANQVSGAAPDLTHFGTRSTFAGGIFNTYTLDESGAYTLDRNMLEDWLRNPPALKDNYTGGAVNRGMPNLGLTQDQIDDLIAFLESTGTPLTDWWAPQSEVE